MASSGRLEPGEKATITAEVDTKGRTGRLDKVIRVSSNDPARPKINLSLRASVKGETPKPKGETPNPKKVKRGPW